MADLKELVLTTSGVNPLKWSSTWHPKHVLHSGSNLRQRWFPKTEDLSQVVCDCCLGELSLRQELQ